MEERISAVINEMSEFLSIGQLRMLQETLVKKFFRGFSL